jgi:hypothetical protein
MTIVETHICAVTIFALHLHNNYVTGHDCASDASRVFSRFPGNREHCMSITNRREYLNNYGRESRANIQKARAYKAAGMFGVEFFLPNLQLPAQICLYAAVDPGYARRVIREYASSGLTESEASTGAKYLRNGSQI